MNRNDTIVRIATMYYEQGYTQTDIAKELGISRPTVASMLNEARELGVVQINVIKTYSNVLEMQDRLKKKYELTNALVSAKNSLDPKKDVGILCADYVEENIRGAEKIGISFGTTVHEYIKHAGHKEFKNVTITPLMGGVEFKSESQHSNLLCFRLASKYNCDMTFFYAPVMAENPEQKKMLSESRMVESALHTARQVDIGIFGVGNPTKNSTYRKLNYITDNQLKALEEKGVVGDICTSFYNKDALAVETPLSDLLIGLSLEDIKNIPEVIVLATGEEKTQSVKTLLQHHIIDTLIIDYELGTQLLK